MHPLAGRESHYCLLCCSSAGPTTLKELYADTCVWQLSGPVIGSLISQLSNTERAFLTSYLWRAHVFALLLVKSCQKNHKKDLKVWPLPFFSPLYVNPEYCHKSLFFPFFFFWDVEQEQWSFCIFLCLRVCVFCSFVCSMCLGKQIAALRVSPCARRGCADSRSSASSSKGLRNCLLLSFYFSRCISPEPQSQNTGTPAAVNQPHYTSQPFAFGAQKPLAVCCRQDNEWVCVVFVHVNMGFCVLRVCVCVCLCVHLCLCLQIFCVYLHLPPA